MANFSKSLTMNWETTCDIPFKRYFLECAINHTNRGGGGHILEWEKSKTKDEKLWKFSYSLYILGIPLNYSLMYSSQCIACCKISTGSLTYKGKKIQKFEGWYDFMPSIYRSFKDLLVVQISHKLTKYWAHNWVLCHMALLVGQDFQNFQNFDEIWSARHMDEIRSVLRACVCLRKITQLSRFLNENRKKNTQKAFQNEKFSLCLRLRKKCL